MDKESVEVSESQLITLLIDTGAKLLAPPSTAEELLAVLDSAEDLLGFLGQNPSDPLRDGLLPVMKGLISDELFRHPDMDVKVSVLCCIHEFLRVSAPEAPYGDDSMKEIFQQTLLVFGQLSLFSGRRYTKALHILETVAKLRSFLILLDLDCDALITQMFQLLLGTIRSNHPDSVFSNMEEIMTWMIEESDEISLDLLNPLLSSVKKENQNISPLSWRLAEKVLKNCQSKVKPFLVEIVERMRKDVEAFTDIVASVWPNTPVEENIEQLQIVAEESIQPEAAKGSGEVLPRRKGRRPGSKKSKDVKEHHEKLIGSKVKVWWPNDREFYEGVVESYDPVKKKHKVVYADGDVENLRLKKERWILLDDKSTQEGGEANLASSSAVQAK